MKTAGEHFPGLRRLSRYEASTARVGLMMGNHWPGCPGQDNRESCWCMPAGDPLRHMRTLFFLSLGMDPWAAPGGKP